MDPVAPERIGYIDGIPIHLLRADEIIQHVVDAIRTQSSVTVSYVNAHVLNLARDNSALRHFLLNSEICYCDGIGPVWALRATGVQVPGRHPGRIIIPQLLAEASRNQWRIGWLGGREGIAEAAFNELKTRLPDLKNVFYEHGYVLSEDESHQVQRIQQARPDILLVGMGSPKQELWLERHRKDLDTPVVWCVGATADYLSGQRAMGPKILLEHQEWLGRLIAEPKRMWRRYLFGNPRFVARMVKSTVWNRSHNKP